MLSVTMASSIMIGVTAVLFAALWWRTHEAGMQWLALGSALAALWYAFGAELPGAGPTISIRAEQLWSAVIAAGVLCTALGVALYLGLPQSRWRWAVVVPMLPAALWIVLLAVGVPVPLLMFQAGVMLAYVSAAILALARARHVPGEGNGVLALVLALLALLPWLLVAAGTPLPQLKNFTGVAGATLRMVLLAVCLFRRERALTVEARRRSLAETQLLDANARLEARVCERTAHLNELIRGLEFFNRGVSHDLRGPLSGMSQLARLAVEHVQRGDSARAERAMQAIASQCDASVQMVAAMLELARIDDRQVTHERSDLCALARAAANEVTLAQDASAAGGAQPVLRCGALPDVSTDPRLLRTVLVNLIGNAAKFGGAASALTIDVSADVQGSDVIVRVSDNGPGFGDADVSRLFEPFYRGSHHAKEGHGLGLAIARRAVEALGGRIWAQSRPGGGAMFCFSLPGSLMDRAAAPAASAV
jgi:signal transduction histidine kinase